MSVARKPSSAGVKRSGKASTDAKKLALLKQLKAAGATIGPAGGRTGSKSSRLTATTLDSIKKQMSGGGFTAWGNWPLRIG